MKAIIIVLFLFLGTVWAANHCVCSNDPFGGPNHVCDYGCINAPCSICAEMCLADGGSMSTCSGGCSGSGGICQKKSTVGTQVYQEYLNQQTTAEPDPESDPTDDASVGCSVCNTQWLCNSTTCSYGYALLAGQCYAATIQVNNRNDSSIRITQGSTCYIQTFTDGNCQTVDYGPPDGDISCACCSCFALNPLMNFKINGISILGHAWADPPTSATFSLANHSVKLAKPQKNLSITKLIIDRI